MWCVADVINATLYHCLLFKLGKLYFDRGDFVSLTKILKQLHQSCQTETGEDDIKKGTQLLEIYALEIQMYTEQKNNKKLKVWNWVLWLLEMFSPFRHCMNSHFTSSLPYHTPSLWV